MRLVRSTVTVGGCRSVLSLGHFERAMKTRTKLCVFGLLLIVALGVWQALTGDTYFRQARNMKRAREFVPTVRAKLDALPELRHLRVVEFTAAGGSLLVLVQCNLDNGHATDKLDSWPPND